MTCKTQKHVCLAFGLALSLTFGQAMAQDANNIQFLNQPGSQTPFSDAVRVGKTLFLSGQIGLVPGSSKLASGGIGPETRQTLDNTKATLERYGYALKDVVKCTVLLADIADFAAFNEAYLSYFSRPYPARTAMAVKDLAFGARVEIECIAAMN